MVLTPTMKIKRNVIEDRYLKHGEQWVAQKKQKSYLGVNLTHSI